MDSKFNNLKEEALNPSSSSYSSLSSLSVNDSAFLETVLVDNKQKRHRSLNNTSANSAINTSNSNETEKRKKKLEKTRLLLNSSPNHDENNMNSDEICCVVDEINNNNNSNLNMNSSKQQQQHQQQEKNQYRSGSPKERPLKKKRSKTKEAARVGNFIKDETRMCCSKKCGCVALIAMYICMDALINLFFITKSFSKYPMFDDLNIKTLVYDVWLISLTRDFFLFIIVMIVGIRHKIVYNFVRFVHKKYISSFLCLIMYSYAMGKMLLHADEAHKKGSSSDQNIMLMFIWNIFSAFLFFIAWYMMALLKVKDSNYRKTDVDGGDFGENGEEADIFLGKICYNLFTQKIRF
jgi:hypothetical protein